MLHRISTILSLATLLAACGGGGGGAAPAGNGTTGSAQLTIDTGAGLDATVQGQAAAVVLERADGTRTGNLLRSPQVLVLADPTGSPSGLGLLAPPSGRYHRLHVLLVPGSTAATLRDGTEVQVALPSNDLAFDFATDVDAGSGRTWLTVQHDATAALAGNGFRRSWAPQWHAGTAAGTTFASACIDVTTVQGTSVLGTIDGDDSLNVEVEFEHGSELLDDHGNHRGEGEFLRDLRAGDEIRVSGTVDDRGVLRATRGDRDATNGSTRYLGRIRSLDAGNQTFVFAARLVVRHGRHPEHTGAREFTVDAAAARIHRHHNGTALGFGDLHEGDLVRVAASNTSSPLAATDIALESGNGLPAGPEVHGLVDEVRAAEDTFFVVADGSDPLVLAGQVVTRVEVHVSATTTLFRDSQGVHTPIGLADLVPGTDRVWMRGSASAATVLDAVWVRARGN